MVRAILLSLCLVGCSAQDPAFCKDSLGIKRTADLRVLAKSGNPENLVVLAIDTAPTQRSGLFEAVLAYYDYEYYLLGDGPSKQQPHPARNGLFKDYFFSYRMFRYLETLGQIIKEKGEQAIVVITDANDVMFALGPAEMLKKFKSIGKNIVLSGEMSQTASRLPYIRRLAEELHMEDQLESIDPKTVSLVQLLRDFVLLKGTTWGYGDAPFILWMPEVSKTVSLIKQIPIEPNGPANKYRYVNAGGMVGYAGALRNAIIQMNIQVGDDDQADWNRWYGEFGYSGGSAIIDYQRKALAQVNDHFDMEAVFRLLYDDFSVLPTKNQFKFAWDPETMAVAYHCAGCEQSKMRDFHRQIVNELQSRFSMFSSDQIRFVNECR